MILVTGTTGFIGSVLLDKIIDKFGKENVLALTSRKTEKCDFLLHNNYNFSKNFFIKSGYKNINILVHAGAFIPKSTSQSNERIKCTSNILSTTAILNSILPNLKKIIFISTVDVYADCEVLTEDSPIIPATLYGQSKLYCEKMVQSFALEKGITHQILRIGHVYGPGEEEFQKVIPVMIRKILNKKSVQIFGYGNQVRSFIYVDDVIKSIINSIGLDTFVGPINIVSENKITIKKLALLLNKIAESENLIEFVESKNFIKRDLVFNNFKMKKYLLNNEIALEIGLKIEYEYMKNRINENIY